MEDIPESLQKQTFVSRDTQQNKAIENLSSATLGAKGKG